MTCYLLVLANHRFETRQELSCEQTFLRTDHISIVLLTWQIRALEGAEDHKDLYQPGNFRLKRRLEVTFPRRLTAIAGYLQVDRPYVKFVSVHENCFQSDNIT